MKQFIILMTDGSYVTNYINGLVYVTENRNQALIFTNRNKADKMAKEIGKQFCSVKTK